MNKDRCPICRGTGYKPPTKHCSFGGVCKCQTDLLRKHYENHEMSKFQISDTYFKEFLDGT